AVEEPPLAGASGRFFFSPRHPAPGASERRCRFGATPFHTCASAGGSFFSVMFGHRGASRAFSSTYSAHFAGTSLSAKIAPLGHAGAHSPQSMQVSGLMARKFSPSWKASTGHSQTQSMYLHLTQFSVTTNAIGRPSFRGR